MEDERRLMLAVPGIRRQLPDPQTQEPLGRGKGAGVAGLDGGVEKQRSSPGPLGALFDQRRGNGIVFGGPQRHDRIGILLGLAGLGKALSPVAVPGRVRNAYPTLGKAPGHRQMQPGTLGVIAQQVHGLLHPVVAEVQHGTAVGPVEGQRIGREQDSAFQGGSEAVGKVTRFSAAGQCQEAQGAGVPQTRRGDQPIQGRSRQLP